MIAQDPSVAAVKEAVLKCGASAEHIVILGTNEFVTHDSAGLLRDATNFHVGFDDLERQETSVAVYAATSGTTGLPKAAELSHKYLVTQALQLEVAFTKRKNEVRLMTIEFT